LAEAAIQVDESQPGLSVQPLAPSGGRSTADVCTLAVRVGDAHAQAIRRADDTSQKGRRDIG